MVYKVVRYGKNGNMKGSGTTSNMGSVVKDAEGRGEKITVDPKTREITLTEQ